ncbi:MAG: TonB-dependent receptor, partial [Chitinophagia bacterium]|nr:TonB-dependent receptor [Chitinophagia bacterium]
GNDTVYKANVPSGIIDPNNGGGRYYSTLYEKIFSFNHNYSQKIKLGNSYSFTANVGNYIEMKSRILTIRQLGYTINLLNNGPRADSLRKLGINDIFAVNNVGGTKDFIIDEGTNTSDKYTAKNNMVASYASINAPIGKHIQITGGARYEMNTQSIVGYVSTDTLKPEFKTKFLLPSVNASYNLNEKSLFRVAYGKTLNRPEFREFAPVVYYDFEDLNLIKGSLYPSNSSPNGDTLKVAEIHNFDVRYEIYPSKGEMIHIGAFYKTIDNAIQRVIDPGTSGDNKTITYINGSKGYCMGLELDLRKNLGFLDPMCGTSFLKDITFVGNFAFSKSQSKVDTTKKHFQIPEATLQGQSPYLINLGMYYQNDKSGIKSSLLYNTFGSRLYATGTVLIAGESIGELPFQSLDLTLSKIFYKHYMLNIGIQNLLDSRVTFVKDIDRDGKFKSNSADRVYKTFKPGRYFTIGVKVNL